eukprot:978573-Ditylum_brightwellii.AAC.1
MMAAMNNRESKPHRVFIQENTGLITSPAAYKQLMKSHNLYAETMYAVAVEGLHESTLGKEMDVGDKKVSICDYLLRKNRKTK